MSRRSAFVLPLALAGVLALLTTLPMAAQSEKEGKSPATATADVNLKTVKYADLGKAIRNQRGKVVVADIWASWCIPCKKQFHHLVDLHKKYGGDGLVCVSVAIDDPENHEVALKFLNKQKATFANFRLEEEKEDAFKLLNLKSIPAAFVFDKEGRRAAKFTMDDPENQLDYEKDVEPLVRTLLKAK